MLNVHIAVYVAKQKAFEKDWPMAPFSYNDGQYTKVYKMPYSVYINQYRKVTEYGSLTAKPCTNYVKLNVSLTGKTLKLFVKETQVLKVLEILQNDPDKPGYSVPFISVTMRKIKIPNKKKKLVEPIVLKSLAALGIAA